MAEEIVGPSAGTPDETKCVELEKKIFDLESEMIALAKAKWDTEARIKAMEEQLKALSAENAKKLSKLEAKIVGLSTAVCGD